MSGPGRRYPDERLGRHVPCAVLTAVVVGVASAGCAGGVATSATASAGGASGVPTASATVPPSAAPGRTPAPSRPSPTPGPPTIGTDLRDGRYPAHIVAVAAARRIVTVDVVQIFFGDAAARAAQEDGATEVPPPDDYWIRNTSRRTRRLPVAPEAPVTVNVHGAQESGSATKDVARSLEQLAGLKGLDDGVFWLTLRRGAVVRIAEQYLP